MKAASERRQAQIGGDIDDLMNAMIPLCNEAELNSIIYATLSVAYIYARSATGPGGEPVEVSRKQIKQHFNRVLDDVMKKLTDDKVKENLLKPH